MSHAVFTKKISVCLTEEQLEQLRNQFDQLILEAITTHSYKPTFSDFLRDKLMGVGQ